MENNSNSYSNVKSRLYLRAKMNKDTERPKVENKIIKYTHPHIHNTTQHKGERDPLLILPLINNHNSSSNSINKQSNNKQTPSSTAKLPPSKSYTSNIKKPQLRIQKGFKKNYKEYLKENVLKSIQFFLDPLSLKNFMLTCKKFNKAASENDELWYIYYKKKFVTKKLKYEDNRGKWKSVFYNSIMSIFKTNYTNLKNKYLLKETKNSYQAKKDPYYIANHLYSHLKPIYTLELDGRVFKIKHVFSNKILSHINFFANFDKEYIDLNKVKNLKLLVSERNLGLINILLVNYDIKKKKFEEFSASTSRICKIFYDNELTLSTFDKNLIFFFNISLPICKICESLFDFMKGIHGKNLDYFDDVDSKFGLYDYSLLINIKSWNNIFYTINVNTLDFKFGKENNDDYLVFEYDGQSKLKSINIFNF